LNITEGETTMKKRIIGLLSAALAVAIAGIASSQGAKVKVTILGTLKPEIAPEFLDALKTYNASQDKYEVESIPMDGSPFEKMTALYASGNAPTIMGMSQEFPRFQKNLLDVSKTEFNKHAYKGTTDFVKVGNKVYGMALTVEAFGLLYNKAVLDKAIAGDFDANSINSRSSLKSLLAKVAASGTSGMHISPMDWSLGAHMSNIFFAAQGKTHSQRVKFMDNLKAGKVPLLKNKVFTGWLDTVDLLRDYNQNKASPLAATYDDGALALGSGKSGLWFMGNWANPNLLQINAKNEYGVLPFPISDSASSYGNTQISVGVPFYMVIDASQNNKEQQAGAVDFLNWMVLDKAGQDYYINKMKFIPVFDTFKTKPSDAMSRQILSYVQEGRTLEWMNSLYPPEGWPSMGAVMQKYLAGKSSREELAKDLEDFWKTVKK
jgi:raffinose/stachyose/melibiose transport system substrate-binding protein